MRYQELSTPALRQALQDLNGPYAYDLDDPYERAEYYGRLWRIKDELRIRALASYDGPDDPFVDGEVAA